jgi:site-specific DNA recombinase
MTRGYGVDSNAHSSQGLWALRAEPGPGFRWGAIKRRSRPDSDGTENSTARQEDEIYRWVEEHNEGRIVAVYTDIASAFDEKARRPEFDNALEDLRAKRIDGLIVWRVDRLTRQRSQMRRILTMLEECQGRLVATSQGVDTADPNKKEITELVLNVYTGMAQGESEAISERVRLAHYDLARKGVPHLGGERPFGHNVIPSVKDERGKVIEHARFFLNEPEVAILHEAGKRVLEGEAVYSIARDFTERQIPTTRGATLWHPEVLSGMLRSPRMVAMHEYGGILYSSNNVPAIFERDEWERIVAKMERKPKAPTETRLLSNIATCDLCSNHLRAGGSGNPRGTRGRDPQEFVYRCRNKTRIRDDGACGKLQITGALADAEVARRVVAYISERANVERILLTYADKENVDAIQTRENELTESLNALSKALTPPPGVPRMPLETYYARVAEIEDERRTIHRRLAVTREAAMLNEVMETADVAAEWAQRGVRWQRAIIKLVVASIVIEHRGKGQKGIPAHERRFDPTRIRMQFVGDAIE